MKEINIPDEYLEKLWYAEEAGSNSLQEYQKRVGSSFDQTILDRLGEKGLITLDKTRQTISFTTAGKAHATLLIRSHRLAERLIHDVLGGEYEAGACEFEHITNSGLVDAICTLLGHPRECPHGFVIPEGECCRRSSDMVKRSVIPLTELAIGQAARIAYVYSRNDQQLHILEGMQLRPGIKIKLHQKYPTYVVEVENASIALDQEVAANIQVWKDTCEFRMVSSQPVQPGRHRRGFLRFGQRRE